MTNNPLIDDRIDVAYKCRCMSQEAGLYVRGYNPGETCDQWMKGPLRHAISQDHTRRSPRCSQLITEYVALPFDVNDPKFQKRPVVLQ